MPDSEIFEARTSWLQEDSGESPEIVSVVQLIEWGVEMCSEMLTGEASRGSDEGRTSGRVRSCTVHVYIYTPGKSLVADAGKLEPVNTNLKVYGVTVVCAHSEARVALRQRSLAVGTYSCW